MEKFEYIAHMFNVRTNRKKYENYVVNAIYNRVGASNLVPVTQQFVRNPRDSRRYYLLDLYFPQLNYGIEVDEGHHLMQNNIINDANREQVIKSAIECEEGRIEIFEINGDSIRMRSFEDIEKQINDQVDIIKKKISEKSTLEWKTNDDLKEEVKYKGIFSVSDNVDYKGITEIYNITGHEAKQLRRCFYSLNEDYYLWVPTLAIIKDDGTVISSNNYENYLKEDQSEIIEYDKTHSRPNWNKSNWDGKKKRVVFLKMRDRFGIKCVKFIGVFKATEIRDGGRHYKLIEKSVKINDLKPAMRRK